MTLSLSSVDQRPALGRIVRHSGVAGQLAYSVAVTYPGEPARVVTFTGSVYGAPGPVVMITPANPRGMFVSSPERFGATFGPAWVRSFFA